jgi:acrylyl-CoA reductase (NADPH)
MRCLLRQRTRAKIAMLHWRRIAGGIVERAGASINKADVGYSAKLTQVDESQLPEGNVTVRVEYSTLNYNDGLAITGKSPVVRKFPMVPGIELAGVVESSDDPDWKPGDDVVLNGWGVGEVHWGVLAQKARLRGEWLVPLPAAFRRKQAMAIGTAMLCVLAQERHGVTPDQGEILVTGASGGLGSVAIARLAKRGYTVVACTGRLNETDYLQSLGESSVIDRNELSQPGKPLARERWAGVVDSVGSHTLANACANTKYRGTVAACGLAQGGLSIDSCAFHLARRDACGHRQRDVPEARSAGGGMEALAADLDPAKLDAITTSIKLSQAVERALDILAGKVRGRLVVDVNS